MLLVGSFVARWLVTRIHRDETAGLTELPLCTGVDIVLEGDRKIGNAHELRNFRPKLRLGVTDYSKCMYSQPGLVLTSFECIYNARFAKLWGLNAVHDTTTEQHWVTCYAPFLPSFSDLKTIWRCKLRII